MTAGSRVYFGGLIVVSGVLRRMCFAGKEMLDIEVVVLKESIERVRRTDVIVEETETRISVQKDCLSLLASVEGVLASAARRDYWTWCSERES